MIASPAPVNGTYQAGQTITFCYTIDYYNHVSTNWLLGVVPQFGSGWDISTLASSGAPTTSDTAWIWTSNVTSSSTGLNVPDFGWYYDTYGDGDPGNNYGEPGNGPYTFCWQITTLPTGSCAEGADLTVSVDNYADGELGSWSNVACQADTSFTFNASSTCCPEPTAVFTNETCAGDADGQITATGIGAAPWDYVWTNSGGTTLQTNNNVNGTDTLTGLVADTYTVSVTDNNGCTSSLEVIISSVTADTIILTSAVGTGGQSLCVNTAITAITYATTGATGASFTGLPTGVNGIWTGNIVTISGTPTTAVGSPFNYTVTLTGGCGTVNAIGVITISDITADATPNVTPICSVGNAVFNITGTPNSVVTYNINGGGSQTVTLNGAGTATVTIPGVSVNQTINLESSTLPGAPTIENGVSATGGGNPANAVGTMFAV